MSNGAMESARDGPAERQEHDPSSPWWGDHVSRYRWAASYVRGKVVLDAACGTGFGASILSTAGAASVVGLDIDFDSVWGAAQVCGGGPGGCLVGDVTQFPFTAQTFDMVTTFETIEHVPDFMACLREFWRVLKEGGLLFCSTPNRVITSPDGIIQNPYHVQEFTAAEFSQVLSDVFGDVQVLGQRCRRELTASLVSRIVWRGLTLRGIRKLPWRIREAASRALTCSPLFPASEEFIIGPDPVGSPTLIGVCRKGRRSGEEAWLTANS